MKEEKNPPSDFNGASYALWLETQQTDALAEKRATSRGVDRMVSTSNAVLFLIFILGVGGLLCYIGYRLLF